LNRKVQPSSLDYVCEKYQLQFYLTSAMTGQGIQDMIHEVTSVLQNRKIPETEAIPIEPINSIEKSKNCC
jgi:hypothetical protein